MRVTCVAVSSLALPMRSGESLRRPRRALNYEKIVSPNEAAANCQVCGKQMDSTNGSSIPCYELVKMPDGTNV
jgi:hypothetical protein